MGLATDQERRIGIVARFKSEELRVISTVYEVQEDQRLGPLPVRLLRQGRVVGSIPTAPPNTSGDGAKRIAPPEHDTSVHLDPAVSAMVAGPSRNSDGLLALLSVNHSAFVDDEGVATSLSTDGEGADGVFKTVMVTSVVVQRRG
jgi:hypothetical protein